MSRHGKSKFPGPQLPRGFLPKVKKSEAKLRQALEDAAAVQRANGGRSVIPLMVNSSHIYDDLCRQDPSFRRKPQLNVRRWIELAQHILLSERQAAQAQLAAARELSDEESFGSESFEGSDDDDDDESFLSADSADDQVSGSSDPEAQQQDGGALSLVWEDPPAAAAPVLAINAVLTSRYKQLQQPGGSNAPPSPSIHAPSSSSASKLSSSSSSSTALTSSNPRPLTLPANTTIPLQRTLSSLGGSASAPASPLPAPEPNPPKTAASRRESQAAARRQGASKRGTPSSAKTKTLRPKRQRLIDEADPANAGSARYPPADIPSSRFSDLGGIEHVLQDVRELIKYPLRHPELYAHLGTEPPRGILLHGPPGCGKTLLAHAIAGEMGVPFFKVAATEIVGGMSGESEQRIRDLFAAAVHNAPALIFIDEIDSITPKRETAQREMERRIVAQLLYCIDALSLAATKGKLVMVIGATNRPDALDSSLRRTGRFDREICLAVPDLAARLGILRVLCNGLRLTGDFDFQLLARETPGFVGADLAALVKEAAVIAVNRIFQQLGATKDYRLKASILSGASTFNSTPSSSSLSSSHLLDDDDDDDDTNNKNNNTKNNHNTNDIDNNNDVSLFPEDHPIPSSPLGDDSPCAQEGNEENLLERDEPLTSEEMSDLYITMRDFTIALTKVQPSAKREGFATVPNVTWADIGALESVRKELYSSIVAPIQHALRFRAYGISMAAGVLMFGPPGCGKTMLAKAIANEASANFISVKGPELLNKYVGDSERAVRSVFSRAQSSAPCIVFFDELDALAPRRGGGGDGGSMAAERVVNQLLTEMDGLNERKDVFVIGATNRPDIIDKAMLRPGRLDKLLYVPLPTTEERVLILSTLTKKMPLHADVDLHELAVQSNRFSGADLSALSREAAIFALESEGFNHPNPPPPSIRHAHFIAALQKIVPSVSPADERLYNRLRKEIHQSSELNPQPQQQVEPILTTSNQSNF